MRKGRTASHFSTNVLLFLCLLNLVVESSGLTSESVPLLVVLLSRIRLRGSPTKHKHFLVKVKCVQSQPASAQAVLIHCWWDIIRKVMNWNSYETHVIVELVFRAKTTA